MENNISNYTEYYQSRKPIPFGDFLIKKLHKKFFDIAMKNIPNFQNLSLLELGTGWGYFAEICKKGGIKYQGIELNGDQVLNLQNQGFNVLNTHVPPFPDGEDIDVIWISHVLEHANGYEHARDMLISAKERLNKGYVVVIAPDYIKWKWNFWDGDWSHGFPTTKRRVTQLLNETGFNVIYSTYITGNQHSPLAVLFLDFFFSIVPVDFIDLILKKLTGKTLCFSFMTVFGWRQIYLIGQVD